MRIFQAIPFAPTPTAASRLWYEYLHVPLVELGHDVHLFSQDLTDFYVHGGDPTWVERHRPLLAEKLLAELREAHARKPFDVFFAYFYDLCVEPGLLEEVRRLGIFTLNFSCNNVHQFDLVQEISPKFDLCWVPEKEALAHYARVGATTLHLQMAASPKLARPFDVPREYDVTFVGLKYGERPIYVRHLLKHGVDVRVWGPDWAERFIHKRHLDRVRGQTRSVGDLVGLVPRALRAARRVVQDRQLAGVAGPPLDDEEVMRMHSRSRISLGFTALGNTHLDAKPLRQLRLREFEAPMCGALYLTGYLDELEDCFELGREMLAYRDEHELLDKVRYYLRHEDEAERIRQAGRARALRDHTWEARMKTVLGEVSRRLGR